MVTARLLCTAKQPVEYPEGEVLLTFIAPYDKHDPNPVNAAWASATPCLNFSMQVANAAAHERFDVGKVYEIAFKPVG